MQNDGFVTTFRVSDGSTVKLEHRDSLSSTAEVAREYARMGYPDRYAIVTEKKTTATFLGTKSAEKNVENGLFISCILRPSIFSSQAGLLGPLATVAFATALEEHTQKKIGIGWVTDIFCEGERIGGCTLEGKLDSYASYEYIIVSFAVRLDPDDFPPQLTDMVRQVFETDNLSIGTIIAKTVLNKFFAIYRDLKNPSKYMDVYRKKFVLTDKKIKYVQSDKKLNLRVMGVDKDTCALVVQDSKGKIMNIFSPTNVILPKKL